MRSVFPPRKKPNRLRKTPRRRQTRGLAQAKNRWRNALVSSGLPADLAPGQIRSLMSRNEEMIDIRRRLDHRYEELQQRNSRVGGPQASRCRCGGRGRSVGVGGRPDRRHARVDVGHWPISSPQQKRLDELRLRARRMRRKRKKIDKSIRRHKAYPQAAFPRGWHDGRGGVSPTRFAHFAEIESLRARSGGDPS